VVGDQGPVPAPVDRRHESLGGVLVPGTAAGAGPGAASRAHPHVVLVQPVQAAPGGQGAPASMAAHKLVKPGNVLPTVAAPASSIPGTASPSTAAAITSR